MPYCVRAAAGVGSLAEAAAAYCAAVGERIGEDFNGAAVGRGRAAAQRVDRRAGVDGNRRGFEEDSAAGGGAATAAGAAAAGAAGAA